MGWKVITVGIAATFAVLFALMGRYEINTNSIYIAYRLDRWTGKVVVIDGGEISHYLNPNPP